MKDVLWQYDHGLKKNFQKQSIVEKIELRAKIMWAL